MTKTILTVFFWDTVYIYHENYSRCIQYIVTQHIASVMTAAKATTVIPWPPGLDLNLARPCLVKIRQLPSHKFSDIILQKLIMKSALQLYTVLPPWLYFKCGFLNLEALRTPERSGCTKWTKLLNVATCRKETKISDSQINTTNYPNTPN